MKTVIKLLPDTLARLYKLAGVKTSQTNTISKSTAENNTASRVNVQNPVLK